MYNKLSKIFSTKRAVVFARILILIINQALAVSQSIPQVPTSPDYRYDWWCTWYEYQNIRDDRDEAFTSLLWDGVIVE
jgi:hypothetical protein